MGDNRSGRTWDIVSDDYTEGQVETILNECGIKIDTDTMTDFLVYCPFHGNKHTPSMTISKTNGRWMCWNASCGESGDLKLLVKAMLKLNEFQIARLIHKAGEDHQVSFRDRFLKLAAGPVELQEWEHAATYPNLIKNFWESAQAMQYMHERGFEDETLHRFKVGYSVKKNLLTVPMYNSGGMLLGVVGRTASHHDKRFKNSQKLPKTKTLWNIHNAKRTGDTVIVVEASFDGMRVDQAGFPNVVACLGGSFSDNHQEQLDRHFNTIILMTDFDDKEKYRYVKCSRCRRRGVEKCVGHNPGRDLGEAIANKMTGKTIKWAAMGNGVIYPDGAKDASDMTDEQIREVVHNAVSKVEYRTWNIY